MSSELQMQLVLSNLLFLTATTFSHQNLTHDQFFMSFMFHAVLPLQGSAGPIHKILGNNDIIKLQVHLPAIKRYHSTGITDTEVFVKYRPIPNTDNENSQNKSIQK